MRNLSKETVWDMQSIRWMKLINWFRVLRINKCKYLSKYECINKRKHLSQHQCKYLSKYKCKYLSNKCKYIGKYKCLNQCKHIGKHKCVNQRKHLGKYKCLNQCKHLSKHKCVNQRKHISKYPNVKMSVLDSLFEKCDFYLDINHEGEIVDAVHRAFLNNMLIVGYEETMHNAYYTADTNTFKESEYADMAEALNLTLAMPHLIDEALAMQKKAAVAADATDYMEILHL